MLNNQVENQLISILTLPVNGSVVLALVDVSFTVVR
jgi:hypothetical protein